MDKEILFLDLKGPIINFRVKKVNEEQTVWMPGDCGGGSHFVSE